MTTDITELALITIKNQIRSFDTVVLRENEALALVEALEKAQQRIAELESRTVKLPDLRQVVSGDRYVWSDGVFNYSQDVKAELTAKGIKWEAE